MKDLLLHHFSRINTKIIQKDKVVYVPLNKMQKKKPELNKRKVE